MRYLSLFSGIEAASQAWEPLGWECVGFSEIEAFPSRLLAARYPGVKNLGDVTKITEADIAMLGRIDLIVFGSPCQDLSVAGKRKGLEGARSGLFHDAMRIIGWAREWCDLRGALWENVPGAFTSNKGADFAAVVGALAGLECTAPAKGWGTEGCAVGTEAMVEWATLDAQWFGVAQRRRRVFALADFGDWTRRPPVLLEPEGLRGDSAPRRGTGEAVAGAAAAGAASSSHEVVSAYGGNNTSREIDVAPALLAQGGWKGDFESETFVTHSPVLAFDTTQVTSVANRSNPKPGDACHPLAAGAHAPAIWQPIPIDMRQASRGATMTNNRPEGSSGGAPGTGIGEAGDPCPTISTSHTPAIAYGGWKGDFESETFLAYMPARELRPDGTVVEHFGERDVCDALHTASGSGNKAPLIAFPANLSGTQHASSENLSPSLCAKNPTAVSYSTKLHNTSSNQSGKLYEEYTTSLDASSPPPALLTSMQVRRLTPRECERLQGMRDDYTLIDGAKDGPRYKALGNSMAVPVMAWIGRQIDYSWSFF